MGVKTHMWLLAVERRNCKLESRHDTNEELQVGASGEVWYEGDRLPSCTCPFLAVNLKITTWSVTSRHCYHTTSSNFQMY